MKRIALIAALLAPISAHAGGFGPGFGQGFGLQFGGPQFGVTPTQPLYVPPPPAYNPYFQQQQQRYTFPNGSLNCQTFQGAFGSHTTCR